MKRLEQLAAERRTWDRTTLPDLLIVKLTLFDIIQIEKSRLTQSEMVKVRCCLDEVKSKNIQ